MKAANGHCRRGHANAAFVAAAVAGGTLIVGAVVLGPSRLAAGDLEGIAAQPAETPAHRRTAELLAELLRGSHRVLAVRPRQEGHRFADIVLWLRDVDEPGTVGLDELALVWHSRVTHIVGFTTIPAGTPAGDLPPVVAAALAAGDPEAIADAACIDAWRTAEAAETRVIARGLSDVVPAWHAEPDRDGRLHIALRWAPDTSDSPDEASIVVDVRRLDSTPQE